MITRKQWLGAGYLILVTLLIDRISKVWALLTCQCEQAVTSFLSTKCILNRGISWGMLHSENGYVFTALSVLIALFIVLFIWWVYRSINTTGALVGVALILSGAISNLFDRVWYGGVIDFIIVSYRSWSFPVFNAADFFICLGVLLLFLSSLHDTVPHETPKGSV